MAEPESGIERVVVEGYGVPRGSIHGGTYLQRAGMTLFGWIVLLTGVVLLLAFGYLASYTPPMPASSASGVDSLALLVVEQRAKVFGNFTSIIEKLVIGVCLPLMTAILGYLFGTGTSQVRREDERQEQ